MSNSVKYPKMIREKPPEQYFSVSSDSENQLIFSTSQYLTGSENDGIENYLNSFRLLEYKNEFTKQLLRLINDTDLEYGFESDIDVFIRGRLATNSLVTKEWLNHIFIENFYNIKITTSILRTIAHFEYNEVYPQGPTMALAALSHKNPEVRECGIRSYENWANLESLKILEHVQCPEKWLQDYLIKVIKDLREIFLIHDVAH